MSSGARDAVLVSVGDELLAGAHADLNAPQLAAALVEVGREVREVRVVGDDEEQIAAAITAGAQRAPLVIVSGGLGPTLDDVTRHAAARAAGLALLHSEEAWRQIVAWFERAGRDLPASNRRQALVPQGARVLRNPRGTAPGFHCRVGSAELFALPGPPFELAAMLSGEVLPWLAARPVEGELRAVRRFHLVDLPESLFADRVGAWMERDANPQIGVTAKAGVLAVRLVARGRTAEEVEGRLRERALAFLELFADHVFSEDQPELALALGERLLESRVSVTTAESCTGGLVAAQLTRVAGISALFHEGWVVYADEAKERLLGVPRALIERHGAVSREVAEGLARGAAQRAGARLALAVTGIAGPGGGSAEKPVGTVCFATSMDGVVEASLRRWPDAGRDRIREWATNHALALLLRALPRP